MLKWLAKEFRNPGCEFRGAPFWSWNDRLDEKEIRRQIRDFRRAGIGGFFMHSRGGLETPFLSEAWFRVCDAAIDEARRRGMLAWAYDEDRWPSVHAGGLVTERYPEAAGVILEAVREAAYPTLEAGVVAVFRKAGKGWRRVTGAAGNDEYLVFYEHAMKPSGWYNNRTPIDMLSKSAVQHFLEIAYLPYVKRYRKDLGAAMPGIFTDEPNFFPGGQGHAVKGGAALPWGREVRGEFRKRRGYDVADWLPFLIRENVAGGRPADEIRHDYWLTITELFTENFSRQLGDFCHTHGIALTGHYLSEETLANQSRVCGAVMPQYAHMQLPGIDILCRRTAELVTCKQAASVCRQWGRTRLLSELYGASGWDLSLQDQKLIGDWQYALGVNYRCQHLCLYSLRGERKRDYPPSHMPHQPWWGSATPGVGPAAAPHYRMVEDYFARLSAALSAGEPVREVALLHPIRSVWAELAVPYRYPDGPHVRLDKSLYALVERLLYSQIDFDFVDEYLFERHGSIGAGVLRMNKAAYRIVVVPQATHMAPAMATALLAGAAKGLEVLHAGDAPVKVYDARAPRRTLETLSRQLNRLLANCRIPPEALAGRLKELMAEPVLVSPPARLLYMLRRDGKERLLFLTNQSAKPLDAVVRVRGGNNLTCWDCEAGAAIPQPAEETNGGVAFRVHLDIAGSALLSYTAEPPMRLLPGRAAKPPQFQPLPLPKALQYTLDAPNVLYLDRARVSVEDAGVELEGFLPQITRKIRALYGYPSAHYFDMQPWAWPRMPASGKRVTAAYEFEVAVPPKRPLYLAVEAPERKEVRLNGRKISSRPVGCYLDRTFQMLRLPGLKKGHNVIAITEPLDIAFEAEAVYLLGDFGVKNRRLLKRPPLLPAADWTAAGLPYYAGGVTYTLPVSVGEAGEYLVELEHQGACVAGVGVAGGPLTYRAFAPWQFRVRLKKGRNRLAVQLKNSLRNLLGPHHFREAHPMWVGPGELAPPEPYERYVHVPSGLLAARIARC